MMPRITMDEVLRVAHLARLEFDDTEIEVFTYHLGEILDYIGKLNELDTTDVPPTSHVLPVCNVIKTDKAWDSYAREVVLENAPSAEEGHFKVPKVID